LKGGQDVELFTEVVWSSLHGLVTLTQNNRLRPNLSPARLQLGSTASSPDWEPGELVLWNDVLKHGPMVALRR
jgi:hypothetical protein